jgi:hypothetical protein
MVVLPIGWLIFPSWVVPPSWLVLNQFDLTAINSITTTIQQITVTPYLDR